MSFSDSVGQSDNQAQAKNRKNMHDNMCASGKYEFTHGDSGTGECEENPL